MGVAEGHRADAGLALGIALGVTEDAGDGVLPATVAAFDVGALEGLLGITGGLLQFVVRQALEGAPAHHAV